MIGLPVSFQVFTIKPADGIFDGLIGFDYIISFPESLVEEDINLIVQYIVGLETVLSGKFLNSFSGSVGDGNLRHGGVS